MSVAHTIHFNPSATLAAQCRAAGYPVASIMMRDAMMQEPDELVAEYTRPLWGPAIKRERGLYAPIMDWILEDGRRFSAKLKLRTTTRTIDTLFSREERVCEDYLAMQADFIELLKQSCASPPSGPTPAPSGLSTDEVER